MLKSVGIKKVYDWVKHFFYQQTAVLHMCMLSHSHFHPNRNQSQGKDSDLTVIVALFPSPDLSPFASNSSLPSPLHTQQFLSPQGTPAFSQRSPLPGVLQALVPSPPLSLYSKVAFSDRFV